MYGSYIGHVLVMWVMSHRHVSPACLTGLSDRCASPVCLTGRSHRSNSPVCLTGLSHRHVSPVYLTGVPHRSVSPVCLTGLSHRHVSPACLTGLSVWLAVRLCDCVYVRWSSEFLDRLILVLDPAVWRYELKVFNLVDMSF